MNIKIQAVSELTETERHTLQHNLTWLVDSPWNDSHWFVTLENATLIMSMVIEQVDEMIFEEKEN